VTTIETPHHDPRASLRRAAERRGRAGVGLHRELPPAKNDGEQANYDADQPGKARDPRSNNFEAFPAIGTKFTAQFPYALVGQQAIETQILRSPLPRGVGRAIVYFVWDLGHWH
jgi:hypothetical protein